MSTEGFRVLFNYYKVFYKVYALFFNGFSAVNY